MPLPELIRKTAERLLSEYCESHTADCCQSQSRLNYSIGNDKVTLIEERREHLEMDHWLPRPVAQFRYHHDLCQWTLHYRNYSEQWVFYLNCGPSLDLAKLLHHVDQDPLDLFWL